MQLRGHKVILFISILEIGNNMNETTLKSSMGLLEFANEMNTKQLIHHVTNLLYELSDSRLLIENMPKVGLDSER